MKRFYCPTCGQVAGDDRNIARVKGDRVRRHWMASAMTHAFGSTPDGTRVCPGGPIDREKDRAP